MTRIEGLEKIQAKLHDLGQKVEKSIIRKGLRAGCKIWQSASVAEAPKQSGLMASKVKVRSGGSKKGITRMSVGVDAKDFTGEAFYAAFVLYGHRVGKRELGDSRKQVPANDFMKRAFDSQKTTVVDTTEESWLSQIEDAVK